MRKSLLFLLCFFCLFAPSLEAAKRKLSSVSWVDRNGFAETISDKQRLSQLERVSFLTPQAYQKVTRTFERDAKGDLLAIETTYYDNGQIKQYLEIKNGRAFGRYGEWYESGKPKIECLVIGGQGALTESAQASWLFEGISKAYNQEGCLLGEFFYQNGKLEGEQKHFYPTGEQKVFATYAQGMKEGPLLHYYSTGEVYKMESYHQDLLSGEVQTFYPRGRLQGKEHYSNNRLVTGEYFTKEGDLYCSVEEECGQRMALEEEGSYTVQDIAEGVPHGKVCCYTKEGKLFSSYHIWQEKKHGEEVLYYASNKPKLSIQWYEDQVHGTVKTWYPSGVLESQKEVLNNQKTGHASAWYKTGEVMLIEEYQQDKLLRGRYFKKGEAQPCSEVINGKGEATLFDKEGLFSQKIPYEGGMPVPTKPGREGR